MTTDWDLSGPLPYMQRTRDYYLALGYGNPYRWAEHDAIPFAPVKKPLSESRIALITTAAPFRTDAGDQGPSAAYNAQAKFFEVISFPTSPTPDLRISHVGYDRAHTTAEDPRTWLPLAQLEQASVCGRIGGLTDRFHCLPTTRSQRTTREQDAPEILRRCLEDGADVALLVPN